MVVKTRNAAFHLQERLRAGCINVGGLYFKEEASNLQNRLRGPEMEEMFRSLTAWAWAGELDHRHGTRKRI